MRAHFASTRRQRVRIIPNRTDEKYPAAYLTSVAGLSVFTDIRASTVHVTLILI
jgi:hypothetical protein